MTLHILGIETSCDETSAAVVAEGPRLLSQVVLSQAKQHEQFGGVVPEIASRSHVENLTRVVDQALREANVSSREISGIAVAHRPGLIGALLIGLTTAKSLAWSWEVPLIGVNHLEAHLEAPLLTADNLDLAPPYLGVVLSGGHTDLYVVDSEGRRCIGHTQDDAVGEAFDKVASVLGLGYPGGPAIEREARDGDPHSVKLPRTLLAPDSLDFSFSGIKTAVLYLWRGQNAKTPGPIPTAPPRADIAASFQEAVGDVLIEKVRRALTQTGLQQVVFGGGVTANRVLRERVQAELGSVASRIVFPAPEFSTDNGAMIAALGLRKFQRGETDDLFLDAKAS